MARDLMNHPLALIIFDLLVTTGLLQWLQFATFISECYMTSVHQIEDPKEAWLFSSEIIKGVFSELHKSERWQLIARQRLITTRMQHGVCG